MTTADPISLDQAKRLAANADTILLSATRPADLETPIGAFLRLDDGNPAYLLESVEGGERLGRYSFLGVGPRTAARGPGQRRADPGPAGERARLQPDLPERPCRRATRWRPSARSCRAAGSSPTEGMPRFTGGAVGALAYDAVTSFEPTVPLPDRDPVGVPTAAFIETDLVLVFDHLTHTLSAIASLHTDAPHLEARYRIAEAAIFEALERTARPSAQELAGASTRPTNGNTPAGLGAPIDTSLGRDEYIRAVEVAKDAIAAGEAIQVVLARRQSFGLPADPATGPSAGRDRALPGAPPREPQPVPVLRPHARVRGRRRLARAAAPGRGRQAHDAPDRRDPPARRRRQGRRAARRGAPARSEGARRARDARRTSGGTTSGAFPDRARSASASTWRSSGTATSSTSCRTSRDAFARTSMPSTRCARSSRPARCRAPRRSARCS
jgi:hypothetical protein